MPAGDAELVRSDQPILRGKSRQCDRVVHAAQHLHGGVGVDLDYPVHRYFRWSKVIELTLGTATEHLRRLGERIAAAP